MTTDIKLTETEVMVEGPLVLTGPLFVNDAIHGGLKINGNVGIGTDTPDRSLHVVGQEIHSGGDGGGFSFGDRKMGAELVNNPSNGERFVWYADGGHAKLWSGHDLLSVAGGGDASFAANLTVTGDVSSEGNVAIAGKVQVDGELNIGPGQSGVTISEGKIWITTLTRIQVPDPINNRLKWMPHFGRSDLVEMVNDLKAEVHTLKKELEDLRSKVG